MITEGQGGRAFNSHRNHAALGLSGADEARGCIQHWILGEAIPEKAAQRVFQAASRLLDVGTCGFNDSHTVGR